MADECASTAPQLGLVPLEQSFDVDEIYEQIMLLRLAAKELKAGIFNEELMQVILTCLKQNGPQLEGFFNAWSSDSNAAERLFAEFKVAMDNECFMLSNRMKLLEIVTLRANHWMSHNAGPLMILSDMDDHSALDYTVSSRGLQISRTPEEVSGEIATTEAVVPFNASPKPGSSFSYDYYINGPGVELKISGCSYLYVADTKLLLAYFLSSDLFYEGLKSTAMQLNIIRPATEITAPDRPSIAKYEMDHLELYAQGVLVKAKSPGYENIVKELPQIIRTNVLDLEVISHTPETSTPSSPLRDDSFDTACMSQRGREAYEYYIKNPLPEITAVGRRRRTHFLRPESPLNREKHKVEQAVPPEMEN